jgi:hypothetical protein
MWRAWLVVVVVSACHTVDGVDAGVCVASGSPVGATWSTTGVQDFVVNGVQAPAHSTLAVEVFDLDGGIVAQSPFIDLGDGGSLMTRTTLDHPGRYQWRVDIRCGDGTGPVFLPGGTRWLFDEVPLAQTLPRACNAFARVGSSLFDCDGLVVDQAGAIDPTWATGALVSVLDGPIRYSWADGGVTRQDLFTRQFFEVGATERLLAAPGAVLTDHFVWARERDGGERSAAFDASLLDPFPRAVPSYDVCGIASSDGVVRAFLCGHGFVLDLLDGSLLSEPFMVCDVDFDAGLTGCDAGFSALGGVFRFEAEVGTAVLSAGLLGWFDVTTGALVSQRELVSTQNRPPNLVALQSGESTVLLPWEMSSPLTGVVGPAPSHTVFVVRGGGLHARRSLVWRVDAATGTTRWAELPGQ